MIIDSAETCSFLVFLLGKNKNQSLYSLCGLKLGSLIYLFETSSALGFFFNLIEKNNTNCTYFLLHLSFNKLIFWCLRYTCLLIHFKFYITIVYLACSVYRVSFLFFFLFFLLVF